jgi:Sec-independent protein translocase protein TatA
LIAAAMVDHLFGREPKGLPARARSIAEAIRRLRHRDVPAQQRVTSSAGETKVGSNELTTTLPQTKSQRKERSWRIQIF